MTATGDLRKRLILVRDEVHDLLEDLDEAVRLADQLDDDAINAAAKFLARSTG